MEHSIQEFLSLPDKYKGREIAQAFERTTNDKRLGNIRFEKVEQPNGYVLFLRQNRLTPDKKPSDIYCGLDSVLCTSRDLNEGHASIIIEDNALYPIIGIRNIDPPQISHVYSDPNDEHLYLDAPDEQIIRERIRTVCNSLEMELKKLRINTGADIPAPKAEWKKTQKLDPFVVRAAQAFQRNTKAQIGTTGSTKRHA